MTYRVLVLLWLAMALFLAPGARLAAAPFFELPDGWTDERSPDAWLVQSPEDATGTVTLVAHRVMPVKGDFERWFATEVPKLVEGSFGRTLLKETPERRTDMAGTIGYFHVVERETEPIRIYVLGYPTPAGAQLILVMWPSKVDNFDRRISEAMELARHMRFYDFALTGELLGSEGTRDAVEGTESWEVSEDGASVVRTSRRDATGREVVLVTLPAEQGGGSFDAWFLETAKAVPGPGAKITKASNLARLGTYAIQSLQIAVDGKASTTAIVSGYAIGHFHQAYVILFPAGLDIDDPRIDAAMAHIVRNWMGNVTLTRDSSGRPVTASAVPAKASDSCRTAPITLPLPVIEKSCTGAGNARRCEVKPNARSTTIEQRLCQ